MIKVSETGKKGCTIEVAGRADLICRGICSINFKINGNISGYYSNCWMHFE